MIHDPTPSATQTRSDTSPRAVWLPVLFGAELILVALLYQLLTPIECRLTGLPIACAALRGAAVSTMCLAALAGVYLWAAPPARRALGAILAARASSRRWARLHFAGVALMLLPLLVVPADAMNTDFGGVLAMLGAGALAAAVGGLFWLARPAAWRDWARGRLGLLLVLALGAILMPLLAGAAGPIWYWQRLTEVTFGAVAVLLWLLGEAPMGDPAAQVIGVGGFVVAIADSCSGAEGFALITGFLALYGWLFRSSLRIWRFAFTIWPAALFLSWVLNVVRITALIWIGARVSPDLAVGGFHSFAGWLFFTALALGVLVAASRMGWLHRTAGEDCGMRLRDDPIAALILPFVVFMASGVVVQTFWSVPAQAYPLQVAAMLGALWLMRRPLIALACRPSATALLAGLAVGAVWLALADFEAPAAGPALGGAALAIWVILRITGTVLLVPIIEEAFFRGYVLMRIDDGTVLRRALGVAVSAGLFALLHGRWVAAGVAGVVFALVYLRRTRLADAVAAHAAANAVIAGAALWYGDWSLI